MNNTHLYTNDVVISYIKGNLKINQYALSTTYGVASNHDSLSECVKEELKLERQMIALPKFTHFNTSIDGCLASLTRTYGEEKLVKCKISKN